MKVVALLLCMVGLGLSGCGFKQDPLTGQSDRLRDAGPKKPEKPPEKPVETRNLLIDRSAAVTFVEGQEAFVMVAARSLLPEFDETLVIVENLDEFPDSQFIKAEGKFVWKPRYGTTGASTEIHKILKVRAFATSSKDKNLGALTHAEEIQVTVTKIPEIPIVQQVVDLPPSLREGDSEIFHVLVKDKDGGVTQPVLQFGNPVDKTGEPDRSISSLASYIEVRKVAYDDQTQLWTYDCRIDIRGEITNSAVDAGFSLKVLSGFGKASPVVSTRLTIFTSLDQWLNTWAYGQKLKPGVETRLPFVVYSNKGEGQVSILKTGLPGNSVLNCDGPASLRAMKCTLIYTPVGDKSMHFESIDLTLKIQNTDKRDTTVINQTLSLGFTVEALP